jgi:hypothetical protein
VFYLPNMHTILEADESGTLHLPAALLPQPGPRRKYRVDSGNGQVVVAEAGGSSRPWMELAGCCKGESDELREIERVIAAEFEHINPADWQ